MKLLHNDVFTEFSATLRNCASAMDGRPKLANGMLIRRILMILETLLEVTPQRASCTCNSPPTNQRSSCAEATMSASTSQAMYSTSIPERPWTIFKASGR